MQPTYEKIPGAGLTQLNFINTLPCPINISYVHPNQTTKWIEMSAHSFTFQRDLEDQLIPVRAHLSSGSACGGIEFSETEWSGTIQGASMKAFSVIITARAGRLELVRMSKEDPLRKSSSGRPRIGYNKLDTSIFMGDPYIRILIPGSSLT